MTRIYIYIERKLGKGKWKKSFNESLLSRSSPNIYATRNILAVKVWKGESSARDEIPAQNAHCDDLHAPVSGIPAAPPLSGIHRISNTFRPGDPLEIPCARHKNVSFPRLIRGQSPGKMLDSKGVAVHPPPPPSTAYTRLYPSVNFLACPFTRNGWMGSALRSSNTSSNIYSMNGPGLFAPFQNQAVPFHCL